MAIRITKVYTRAGDRGQTALVGGKRVPKDALRLGAYGTIDELNSIVGLASAFNGERLHEAEAHRFLDDVLRRIQNQLFDLGGELATPAKKIRAGMYRVGAREVKWMEETMDLCQKELKPLDSFVLPGGGRIPAFLHQCRTVCRRAEREIFRLTRDEEIGEWPLKYVNRLSDLFFVLARWLSHRLGQAEVLWEPGAKRGDKESEPRRGRAPK